MQAMADSKSTSKTSTSGDKSSSTKSSDELQGWQVMTQRVDNDGNNVSTRTFQFDGPTSESEARKQVEDSLEDNVSIVQFNKL